MNLNDMDMCCVTSVNLQYFQDHWFAFGMFQMTGIQTLVFALMLFLARDTAALFCPYPLWFYGPSL